MRKKRGSLDRLVQGVRSKSLFSKETLLLGLMLLLGALCLFVLGCKEEAPTGVIFSHKGHLGRGFTCGLCHQFFSYTDPTRPPESICAFCHKIGDHEKPTKDCARCHIRLDFSAQSLPRPSYADNKFRHGPHLHKNIECRQCHKHQEKAEIYEDIVFPDMKDCTACHAARAVKSECRSCHRIWRQYRKPENHDHLWARSHGPAARQRFETNCDYCHTNKSFCQDCHMAMPPTSHTLFFKNRGHGSYAETGRMSCLPCHQQDFCLRCHGPEAEVRPLTHTPAWGNRPYLHCAGCHFPAGKAYGCKVCHNAAAVSAKHRDSDATPVPGFVGQTSLNCLNGCHPFESKPPLHPIGALNNNDCLRCHDLEG